MTPDQVELNRLYKGLDAYSRELLSQIARAFMRDQLKAQARGQKRTMVRPPTATNVIAFPRA
jgi:hypothetical protein